MSVSIASRTPKRSVGHLRGEKPTGVHMNCKRLYSVRDICLDNYDTEYMYLRENRLTKFDVEVKLQYLRILDLSINNIGGAVDFLNKTPHLHHLYMTGNKIETLLGISNFAALETLCLSDNAISSFEGLENLPSLRVLSLNFDSISTFKHYPTLPNLHTLNLVGNPITEVPSYRSMAIAINSRNLVSIDGNPIQGGERAAVEHYRGKIAQCIREGFIVEGENVEEAAGAFLLRSQHQNQRPEYLQLCAISLSSTKDGGTILMEGFPVALSLCMQDIRPYEDRISKVFHSPYFYPVIFQVSGEATEVFVVGSMNNWTDPIKLERCEKDGEICFQTTLYLPAGDYEYRYIVDGVEKVSDTNRITSKYNQGFCNLYQVTQQEPNKEPQDTILHVRWMRSHGSGVFEIIENENSLLYTPTLDDINAYLRVEVLGYVDGEFSFLYFDLSSPIVNSPPYCANLQIKGSPVEGSVLTVAAEYSGGIEGHSSITWFRIPIDGNEVPIDLQDPSEGYKLTREDIGCCIRVEFTPVRNDWVAGEPKSVIVGPITPGVPECESIKIIGNLYEGSQLEVEVVYTGGEQGDSVYQWLRKVDADSEAYIPIEGENGTKYTLTAEDVDKCLAVEYTPVNSEGKSGETCRCVLEDPIKAAPPRITNLLISGEPCEGHTLALEYEYSGGTFGEHIIQWYRHHPDTDDRILVGSPNSVYLKLSRDEVGCFIGVTMIPVRFDGERGQQVRTQMDVVVAAAKPEVKCINMVGNPVPGNEISVQIECTGCEVDESAIEWEIEDPDTHNFRLAARGISRYIVSEHDVNKTLRVIYTPVTEDGVEGDTKWLSIQIQGGEMVPVEAQIHHADPSSIENMTSEYKMGTPVVEDMFAKKALLNNTAATEESGSGPEGAANRTHSISEDLNSVHEDLKVNAVSQGSASHKQNDTKTISNDSATPRAPREESSTPH
ncbi:unnamed protein product [Phytomonas sp. EM1]|nr:unnamed protein product [Phytomonas sp. EM1]|eukprot:CCW60340.1 unnamed protein product [Phytomonas sp. isolate EM1]